MITDFVMSLFFALVIWGLMSFITQEPNASKWTESQRAFAAFTWIALSTIIISSNKGK